MESATVTSASSSLPSIGHDPSLNYVWKSAAAGYAAGVTGVVLGHPLDSLKVWMQTNTAGMNKHLASSSGPASITSSLRASTASSVSPSNQMGQGRSMTTSALSLAEPSQELLLSTRIRESLQTMRALYSGISGPLVTVGLIQSINFAIYDSTRRYLHDGDDYSTRDSLTNVGTAGFVSGAAVAFITPPLVLIKTRQQILGSSFRQAFDTTFHNNKGFRGLFVGMGPHLLSETIGRAVYYTTYEACKRSIAQYKQGCPGQHCCDQPQSLTIPERMMAAAMAGIVSWTVIFPWDAVKNRLYHQHIISATVNHDGSTLSTMQMVRRMTQERSLYRGMTVTVLRAGPVAAAVLPVYDTVVQYLHDNY